MFRKSRFRNTIMCATFPATTPRRSSPSKLKLRLKQSSATATMTTATIPAPSSDKVKTRFLIISDTHNASLFPPEIKDVPFREPLPKADVLLHCGDLTMVGHLWEYEKTIEMLATIDADLKLVIAGNHDISLDETFYYRRGQHMQRLKEPDETIPAQARDLWLGEKAKAAGVTYLDEGVHSFTLNNGAKLRVYASPYQPEFCDWAFPYWRNQDRYNPVHQSTPNSMSIAVNPVPDFPAIDVMMTHGPPMGVRDETSRSEHVGCEHLLRAARRSRPLLHCFGHIHEGWGAERIRWKDGEELDAKWEDHVQDKEYIEIDEDKMKGDKAAVLDASQEGGRELQFGKETLMVNASIMTERYRPVQGPFIVDLDLQKA